MVPESSDPKQPRAPRKAGAKKTPPPEAAPKGRGGRQTVEDWLAQKLAALDPDDDEENVPTRAMRQVTPASRAALKPPPLDPGDTPPTANVARPTGGARPAEPAPPVVAAAPVPAVPAADEWPDFEPLTFPSDEIEPLDPPDAVLPLPQQDFATPIPERDPVSTNPGDFEATHRSLPRLASPPRPDPIPSAPAEPSAATRSTPPRPSPAMVVVPQDPVGGGRTVVPPRTHADDDDNMWDLFGDADRTGPPLHFGSASGESELTHPGGWATPAPAPARTTPVITSAPAPGRPRGNDEARVDALIAEVERKAPPPIRVAVQHGAVPATPRRTSGPFSRPPSSGSEDDTGTASTTEADGSFSEDTEEPDRVGRFDEVFPSGPPARRPAPVADEETAALLANTEIERPTRVADEEHDPGTTWTVQPLGSLIDDVESPRKRGSLEKNPLADEKTEIRSFVPIVPDTVEDVPTLINPKQRAVEPDPSWSSTDEDATGPMAASVSELSWNLITWLMVAIGMLAFTMALGLLAIVIFSFLRV